MDINFKNLLMHFLNIALHKLIFNNHEFKTLIKIFIIYKFQNSLKQLKIILYLMLNFFVLEIKKNLHIV